MGLVNWIDRTFYPKFERNWDDKMFRAAIQKHLTPRSVVLDVGAGAGIVEEMHFRGDVAWICGIDLDPRVEQNNKLDEGKHADAGQIPYEDNLFDVVFADNVMEHLEDPKTVFAEISRVLKPGGILLFKTPNRSHYMPLIARLTPHRFHQFINKLRGRAAEDTFPTCYLSNSVEQVTDLAAKTGLEIVDSQRVEGRPEYLRFSFVTYLFGLLYESIVNISPLLSRYRILLIIELRKPEN
jgi:ubiquinone/menaquinone biosynthesis C-methylase UbiE